MLHGNMSTREVEAILDSPKTQSVAQALITKVLAPRQEQGLNRHPLEMFTLSRQLGYSSEEVGSAIALLYATEVLDLVDETSDFLGKIPIFEVNERYLRTSDHCMNCGGVIQDDSKS